VANFREAIRILTQHAPVGNGKNRFNSLWRKGYLFFSMRVTGVLTAKISPARRTAFSVLESVAGGAFASDALRDATRTIDSRDARLASQIVFGVLRYQAQLDFLIALYAGRDIRNFDPPVLIALRSGIFQLRYLDRIPVHAAVHETVELTKAHKRAAVGLVNAVLRKVNRDPIAWPSAEIEFSCPGWLLDRWIDHFGRQQAQDIARAALVEPAHYLRIPTGSLAPEDAVLEPTPVSGCYRALSSLPPSVRLHDIGAQTIIPLLDLAPGHRHLDLCAAPGNKTLQALETPLATAVACDVSFRRLRDVPAVCPRVVLDAACALPFGVQFDRILVDAPCSGTGTLARNPEIKWRLSPEDIQRHKKGQLLIARRAVSQLAPGGKLVYATCSLEREENEEVVRELLAHEPAVRCEREVWRIPGREEGDGFYAAVLTV